MTIRNALSLALISFGAFFVSATEPGDGVRSASAQALKNVRVRIDFRTLFCKNTTGDEPGSDEPYVKFLKMLPGSVPSLQTIPKISVNAGKYAWSGDNRKVLWEGNLKPGQAAAFIVNVMEDDGTPPNWVAWAEDSAKCGGAIATAIVTEGAGATELVKCAGLASDIIRAVNGDDEIGQFTLTVKNDNGVVKKTLHTSGPRSQIGGYDDPALSDSDKTIRMRLGQGTSNPQRYQASLQVRQISNVTSDPNGDALTWAVLGRDDAR